MDEVTHLNPAETDRFWEWVRSSGWGDVDAPDSHYDYRGFFHKYGPEPVIAGRDHLTDEFKQHGHPTFSVESKYSRGPHDGGMWIGDELMRLQPSHSTRTPMDPLQQQMMQRQMANQDPNTPANIAAHPPMPPKPQMDPGMIQKLLQMLGLGGQPAGMPPPPASGPEAAQGVVNTVQQGVMNPAQKAMQWLQGLGGK